MKKNYSKITNRMSSTDTSENVPACKIEEDENMEGSIPELDPPKEPKQAEVLNCSKLNVRAEPTKLSDVLCVIDSGTTVSIIEYHSVDWAHITVLGKNGYVMRAYIKEV